MLRREGLLHNASSSMGARHFISGLNSKFTGKNLSFDEYVMQTRDMIRQVRKKISPHLSEETLEQIVNGNAPFSLPPIGIDIDGKEKKYRRGILLTHGLSDSPYFMRHLATFFQSQGYRVLTVLLPGHGTCPGDLLDMRWQEWANVVAYGTEKLAEEVDELYLGGYSAGGALSMYQCAQDARVKALFLFAPAIDISHRAAFASLHELLSWLFPRMKWLVIKPDVDHYKYESFAKNSASQMYELTKALADKLHDHQINVPVFAVASEDDKTVKVEATIQLMKALPNTANKLILYTADNAKLAQPPVQGNIEWVNSLFPEQKILSSAHTAILLDAEDPHYGVSGEYGSCIHYYPDEMDKYHACMKNPEGCWLGEINEKNLQAGVLRRLMYNPNFVLLKKSLTEFMEIFSK